MEGKGADEREDGGATGDQAGEPSIDSDTFSRCSISELMRTLRENGVDPVKEGLVEKGDLIRRAIELELGGSHLNPSSSPFPLSMGSQREDGAGLIDIEETQEMREEAAEIELTPEQVEKNLSSVSVTEAETQKLDTSSRQWHDVYQESKLRSRVDDESIWSTTGLGTTGDGVSSMGESSISSKSGGGSGNVADIDSNLSSDRYSKGGVDEDGVRAPLPSVRDTLLSDGHLRGNFIGAYDSDTEEAENNSMWLFPPPEGLSATTSFKNTKVLCERQDRWLLVNIQDPLVFASHDLNRVVWSDDTVQSIIHTSFVFWQRSNTSKQVQDFLLRYHIAYNKLPHTSVLDPRTGLMLLQIEGFVEKEDMCMMLVDFLERNHIGQTKAPRLRTVSISGTSSHLSAAEQATEESKQGKEEEEEDQGCHQINVNDAGSSSSVDVQVVEETQGVDTCTSTSLSTEFENSITTPILVTPLPPEPSIDAADVTKVLLKLPDGGKAIARRFLKTDRVELLFRVARSILPTEQMDQPFDITTSFPPRPLSQLKDVTLSEADVSGAALTIRWVSD